MNRKIIPAVFLTILVIVVLALFAATSLIAPAQPALQPTGAMDFTVSASSDCLRFLNSSVPTYYVPFTVAANQNWQLTINCSKMPGGANGWTDVYIYKGYWDQGTNHTCKAIDLYPMLNDIQATNLQVKIGAPYTGSFGGQSMPQSYTVFFVVPPGGASTFHVTLKPVQ